MTRTTLSALACVFGVVLATAVSAGVITSATGPVVVNGEEVTIEPGKPLVLAEGDVLETQGARVVFESDSGDKITLEENSRVRAEGLTDGVDYLFVESGAAYGAIGDGTAIGGTAGWASVPKGKTAKVFLEVPTDRPGAEAGFRAVEGEVYVRYHGYTVRLPPKHSMALAVDPSNPDLLAFRSSQQNPGDVQVTRAVGGGELTAWVPKATVGRIGSDGGGGTRVENDISSLKTGKIRLETKFSGKPAQRAALGPGTYAVIDNKSGSIQASFTAVEFQILEQAISLTNEFATLSQSNFSDVGVDTGPGRR